MTVQIVPTQLNAPPTAEYNNDTNYVVLNLEPEEFKELLNQLHSMRVGAGRVKVGFKPKTIKTIVDHD